MPLSEINIHDVILFHTDTIINASNYQTLRQYLLERKPINTVINNINLFLVEHYNFDKQTTINELTQQACIAQKNNDVHEIQSDEQEEKSNGILKSQYTAELSALELSIPSLNIKSIHQQYNCDLLRNQLEDYKNDLIRVNNAIKQIHYERRQLNAQYNLTQDINSTLVNNLHYHTISIDPYTAQNRLTRDRLFHEEKKWTAERQRLISNINSRERDCIREEKNLSTLLKEKQEAEKLYSHIKHQLNIELPNKKQQRIQRSKERQLRQNARQTNDLNLQQLSYENLITLKKQIAQTINDLEIKKNQLLNAALETSYPIYMAQVGQALDQSYRLQVNFNEYEALKSIYELMSNYSEMEEQEELISQSLTLEKNNLCQLQTKLEQSNEQLMNFIAAKPKLVQANKELTEKNIQLNSKVNSAHTLRTNALYTSLFGFTGTLISVGLLSPIIINPLLLIIPTSLALLTLVSLTVALFSHWKKTSCEYQIIHNKKTIADNETTILKQSTKANELSYSIIPGLNAQIDKSEKTIALIEKELESKQAIMSQILEKAQKITSTQNNNYTFFGNTSPYHAVSPDQPSAPEFEYPEDPPFYQGHLHY